MKRVGLIVLSLVVHSVFGAPDRITPCITCDQFGYRPGDTKVAVLADPQSGYNAADFYTPGPEIQVREWEGDAVVFSGRPEVWNGGAVHAQSGDRGWWFDFSAVEKKGRYYLYDPENGVGSGAFDIRGDIYVDVLKASVRMFYYNRCTIAKESTYAGEQWADGPSFAGPGQDGEAFYVNDKKNTNLQRDLSGGWFDAGDYNKYVTFAEPAVHQLLDAYSQNPEIWTDDYNIPESGNGLPDLIDEIIWELDWIKKMQDLTDGGVFIKNGLITHNTASPPSADRNKRYYGPKCSSSSIAAAGMFAHAALVLDEFDDLDDYAADLVRRAELAWDWYMNNPKSDKCDTQEIKAGDADRSIGAQEQMAVTAAVYLFAVTKKTDYNSYVVQNHRKVENLNWWGPYRMARGDALLYYARLAGGHSATQNYIIAQKQSAVRSLGDFYQFSGKDLYRAQMPDAQYHWGSSSVKANVGNLNYDVVYYNLDSGRQASCLEKAAAVVHYMHGVNPLGMVMLSNMYDLGAENSVNELYHCWFTNGSKWDNALESEYGPPPGYVTGGPNKAYGGSSPGIKDQPPQKAYKDSNGINNSWEIVEPAIYYQSAYIKLLSKFVDKSAVNGSGGGGASNGIIAVYFALSQNYPNPFRSYTQIGYYISHPIDVKIEMFDIKGRHIDTLVDGYKAAGEYCLGYDAGHLPSGVYFCRMSVLGVSTVTKIMIIH